jgi:osmoprotectant transport system permease protein
MIGGLFEFDWVVDNLDQIWERTLEHLQLTLLAVVLGFLISFPIALYAQRHRWLYPPVTWLAGLLYTIPSLALFAFLVPFTGLSTTTAEVGLVSYTLLIIIRNTVAGLDSVPADVKEAARGMGLTSRQILWRVEVVLAVPVIVAGVRIALVTTIGLVTVTSLIGQGGLGYFILQGLQRFYATTIFVGALLSMALAILADRFLIVLERSLTPWSRRAAGAP